MSFQRLAAICCGMAAIDTLQLSRVLRDRAGFSQDAAEATAEALGAAIGGEVATKTDLAALKSELKADIAAVRTELKADINELRNELKADITELRTELKGDIAALRTELKGDIAGNSADIAGIKADIRLLRWQIAVTWALSLAILIKLFVH